MLIGIKSLRSVCRAKRGFLEMESILLSLRRPAIIRRMDWAFAETVVVRELVVERRKDVAFSEVSEVDVWIR